MTIAIKNLYKSFNDHKILDGINLDISEGESFVLLGGSGSGKSVLIKMMIGLIFPDSGSILINDTDINKISMKQKYAIMRKCGFLFQSSALFDSLTVSENITFFAKQLYKLSSIEIERLVTTQLEIVGLSKEISNSYPSELSGGMKKRVALARAICIKPKILFFDEPTTGLDPTLTETITDLIVKIHKLFNATTITITHNIAGAYKIGEKISLLKDGKIAWSGKKQELFIAKNQSIKDFINPYVKERDIYISKDN